MVVIVNKCLNIKWGKERERRIGVTYRHLTAMQTARNLFPVLARLLFFLIADLPPSLSRRDTDGI